MYRHVTSLPIPNEFKSKLVKNGVESLNELANLKPTDLIKDFGFSKNDVVDLNETLNLYQTSTKPVTLYDLLKEQEQQKHLHLSTLSKSFDDILGGGIPLGKITEICGVAGVGKTQICMQMCVNVQIPEKYGGLGGKAIYIDTEGSFISKRVVEIANAVIDLVAKNHNLPNSDELYDNEFSLKRILSNIFYYRCVDHVQLMATISNLKSFVEREPRIKLIVIDSLAYPFRFVDYKDSNSQAMKTNILNNFMTTAYQLTFTKNLAVVVTNQMTTKINRDLANSSTSSNLIPALGETWAHSANLRILLSWKYDKRIATISKSSYLPEVSIFYRISAIGFEAFDDENENLSSKETDTSLFKKRKFE